MNGLDAIFKPRAIAVIGASDREHTINRALFMNLILGNFKGPVFPVNPRHNYVHGIRAYKTVEDIPDRVDLAVIMVPKDAVPSVIDGCARKGVKGVVVITAGYKETGPEGAEQERKLIEQVRNHGIRMIGPNCFGVMNTSPAVSMNATFTAYEPFPGKVGFVSQSGALGEILIDKAGRESLGMAMFASIGNKADVNGDEVVEYWEHEDDVKAIMMYLEDLGSPRKFSNMARRIARVKPIITLKAGRTARGAAAASSHTGALADQDAANLAIFEQYGVIQVDSVGTLFQIGSLLVNQPPPRGRGVAVVTNAGGPGILATDALIQDGLILPDISPEGKAKLSKVLDPAASTRNPIDVIASGGAEDYRAALEVVYAQEDIHSVMVLFVPTIMLDAMDIAVVLAEFSRRWKKPMQVVWLAQGKIHGVEAEKLLRDQGIPMYELPIDSARALASAVNYYEWRAKPVGKKVNFQVQIPAVRSIVSTAVQEKRQALSDKECMDLLHLYGLPTVESRWVETLQQALDAADQLGWPVVLKASRVGLMHKTDIGAVELDIHDADALAGAYNRITSSLEKHGLAGNAKMLVQPMVTIEGGGVECVLGMKNLKKYGPMLMFGLGGILVEVMKAVGFRMVPMTDADAKELVYTSPGWPIFKGTRGKPPVDVDAIVESILRLGQLAWENPEISEIDLNPFLVFPDGRRNAALDFKILLG